MNLEYPDNDRNCDRRSSSTEAHCLSLRNPFRFDFNINGHRGVIVERHSLCAWDACSQSCYAAKPDEDAATQVSHFLLLLVVFWATIPYCRCVMWLVETYLLAPSPWAKEAEVEYDPEAASQEILARCDGPAPAWWPNVGETGAPEPKAPQPEPETEPARAEVSGVREQSFGLLSPGTAAALSGALAVETRRAAAAEAVAREAAGEPAYAGEVVVTGEVVAGEVPGEPVHAGETGRVDLADWQRSWGT